MIGLGEEGSGQERRPLFSLGTVVATRGALAEIPAENIFRALCRHISGDWGDVCAEDGRANDRALKEGTRLVSVYRSAEGQKYYVITEADRSVTTVLLPEEY